MIHVGEKTNGAQGKLKVRVGGGEGKVASEEET